MDTGMTAVDLRDLFVLRRVPEELVLEAFSGCRVIEIDEGRYLLRAGQSNQDLYLIISGSFTVHLDSPETEPVALLNAGETVGELSVIDDSPVSAFVVARSPSRVLEVKESSFWKLISTSHDFARNMLLLLTNRMRTSDRTVSENMRMRSRFENEAMIDALTGLKNRRWLDRFLPRILNRHRMGESPLCIIMFDIDDFKMCNDRFGHDAGDEVLRSVAATALGCLRPTDLCARYGGEEFVVILPGVSARYGWTVAERMRTAVRGRKVKTPDGRTLPPVTVSLGIAQADLEDDAASLVRRADSAMYRAKSSGKDQTCGGTADD